MASVSMPGEFLGEDRAPVMDPDRMGDGKPSRARPDLERPGESDGDDGHAGPRDQDGDPRLERTELAVGAPGPLGEEGDDPAGAEAAQRLLHARGAHPLALDRERTRPTGSVKPGTGTKSVDRAT